MNMCIGMHGHMHMHMPMHKSIHMTRPVCMHMSMNVHKSASQAVSMPRTTSRFCLAKGISILNKSRTALGIVRSVGSIRATSSGRRK